jgi:succinate dehydrogenase hydrophobic anchor subunit
MRSGLRLFVPLTVVAALLATALIAAPSRYGIQAISLNDATAMMQKTAVIASLLAIWMFAAVALTLLSGREIRYSSLEMRASALHCFALGLVAVTSFILTAIVFDYLIPFHVGIPLLFALGVFAILTKIYGTIAVFHAIGTLVAGARTREQMANRKWLRGDLAMVVIGVIILGAIRLIPIIGPIIWGLASIFGIGTALATKFGRREPWFLAYRLNLS